MININEDLKNNSNYNQYIKHKDYYDNILKKYVDRTSDDILINYLNMCLMLISRYNDYDFIMISLNNALDFKIDGVISNDIDIYANNIYMNKILKDLYLIETKIYIKFKNNESNMFNDMTYFGILLPFNNTTTICDFYINNHSNNNIMTIPNFKNYTIYNMVEKPYNCVDDEGVFTAFCDTYYENIPFRFNFNYFIGG
jgi:hypothetical protein